MQFIGRDVEFNILHDFYRHHRAALLMLYGRRDVGKTRLIQEWVEREAIPAVLYWAAALDNLDAQRDSLFKALASFAASFNSAPPPPRYPREWRDAFSYSGAIADVTRSPVLLIVDEFTNLVQLERGMASEFQIAWDHVLSHIPNLRVILLGSSIRVMHHDILSYRAPLYGRAWHILKLEALRFGVLYELFPEWSTAERVALYAVSGGIPPLLEHFVGATDFNEGLRWHVMQDRVLKSEAALLRKQVPSVSLAERVLAAIAHGAQDRDQMARAAGARPQRIVPILKRLGALDFIKQQAPLLAPFTRNCCYEFSDHAVRFHYRFIFPRLKTARRVTPDEILRSVAKGLERFIGEHTFGALCREWLFTFSAHKLLGFWPERVGTLLTARDKAIGKWNIVAVSRQDKSILIGRVRWNERPIARNEITDLARATRRLSKLYEEWSVHPVLFCNHTLASGDLERARSLSVGCVVLARVESGLVEMEHYRESEPPLEIEF